jgi:hypothetical protein
MKQGKLLFNDRKSKTRITSYNPVLITTSNILTENQIIHALREIENLRSENEQGTKEQILMEKVLPEFMIYVFCKKFNFNRESAIEKLKIQEEHRELFAQNELTDM